MTVGGVTNSEFNFHHLVFVCVSVEVAGTQLNTLLLCVHCLTPCRPSQLLFNLIAEIIGSYWLALIFQTSHVISEVCCILSAIYHCNRIEVSVHSLSLLPQVEWPKPDPKDKMVHMDW